MASPSPTRSQLPGSRSPIREQGTIIVGGRFSQDESELEAVQSRWKESGGSTTSCPRSLRTPTRGADHRHPAGITGNPSSGASPPAPSSLGAGTSGPGLGAPRVHGRGAGGVPPLMNTAPPSPFAEAQDGNEIFVPGNPVRTTSPGGPGGDERARCHRAALPGRALKMSPGCLGEERAAVNPERTTHCGREPGNAQSPGNWRCACPGGLHGAPWAAMAGVGKDVLDSHPQPEQAPRQPFVSLNCGAIPEHQLESERSATKRGPFPGADRNASRACSRRRPAAPCSWTRWASAPEPAGQALEGFTGAALPPPGQREDPGRASAPGRHQPRPQADGQRGPVPRGPFLRLYGCPRGPPLRERREDILPLAYLPQTYYKKYGVSRPWAMSCWRVETYPGRATCASCKTYRAPGVPPTRGVGAARTCPAAWRPHREAPTATLWGTRACAARGPDELEKRLIQKALAQTRTPGKQPSPGSPHSTWCARPKSTTCQRRATHPALGSRQAESGGRMCALPVRWLAKPF